MLVYLDSCCFSREFTDHGIKRNIDDASDVRVVLALIHSRRFRYASSPWLLKELNEAKPASLRRQLLARLPLTCDAFAPQATKLLDRIRVLAQVGFSFKDSSHIASAEAVDADVMLTTDDELAELARQHAMMLTVKVRLVGPWLSQILNEDA